LAVRSLPLDPVTKQAVSLFSFASNRNPSRPFFWRLLPSATLDPLSLFLSYEYGMLKQDFFFPPLTIELNVTGPLVLFPLRRNQAFFLLPGGGLFPRFWLFLFGVPFDLLFFLRQEHQLAAIGVLSSSLFRVPFLPLPPF